ncbi:MAG: carbohydrate porin, partial [Terrimicrobiaceae bacterium]
MLRPESAALGFFFLLGGSLAGLTADPQASAETTAEQVFGPELGISANPAAVNRMTGNGGFVRWLGLKKDSGVFLGGVWVGNSNSVISGGEEPGAWSWNSLLIVSMGLHLNELVGWKGGKLGIEFLQFNGEHTNREAGSVQGYNGTGGPEPYNRTELSQLWFRQELFEGKVIVRVGKMAPTVDFNNVQRP